MDFKKLFRKDDKAVSPVIGVILMVAITVILAAAIGSSVFSHGTAKSGPQANINIKQGTTAGSLVFEHLGGDSFLYNDVDFKIYKNGGANITGVIGFPPSGSTDTSTFSAGDVITITNTTAVASDNVQVKLIDKSTNQLICDKTIKIY